MSQKNDFSFLFFAAFTFFTLNSDAFAFSDDSIISYRQKSFGYYPIRPIRNHPPASQPTPSPTPIPTATTVPTPVPTATASPLPNPTTAGTLTGTAALDTEELTFATLINNYREQNGLTALQVSVDLTKSSDWMSNDMASKNYFSHTDSLGRDPFTRMTIFGYLNPMAAGENIAAGNADAQNTFLQWKNSPPHNANMLSSDYKVIGIARATNTNSMYDWYWTTDFGSEVDTTVTLH